MCFIALSFQFGEGFEVFRAAGGAFEFDQFGQGNAPEFHPEGLEFGGVRQEFFVGAASNDLP